MRTVLMDAGYLPWNRNTAEERLFLKTLLYVMAVSALLGLLVPMLELPETAHDTAATVPPRVARFLMERKRTPPPLEIKKEKKEVPPKEEAEKKEPPREIDRVREKAKSSGLLKGMDLAGLLGNDAVDKANTLSPLTADGKKAVRLGDNIITSAAKGSGGIDTSGYRRDSGRGGALGEHVPGQVEAVNPSLVAVQQEAFKHKKQPKLRDQENVIRTLDRSKGRVYAIYNRALRKNPLLAGRVVLELTIEPSGRVSACRIVSSELQDEVLENKLRAFAKMLNFGEENVPVFTFRYPIEFMPS